MKRGKKGEKIKVITEETTTVGKKKTTTLTLTLTLILILIKVTATKKVVLNTHGLQMKEADPTEKVSSS